MQKQAEKRLQNAILRSFGTRSDMRLWRQNTGVAFYPDWQTGQRRAVRFGLPGAADLSGILPDGRRLEIEVKSPKGRQTKEQAAYQRMIERFGGLYVLARSLSDVEVALQEAER